MAMSVERTGQVSGGVLAPLSALIAQRIADERDGETLTRDPDFVSRLVPPVQQFVRYFSPEVRGIENLPASGPVLVVGNHSCLFYMPDTWVVALAITARRGVKAPAYALVYDLLLGIPVVGSALRRLGGIPANGREAERVLAEGAAVLVYPGGDLEACRPWTERNRIVFSGHSGFIRLALRAGVPVVPVVSYGSHHAVVVLSRGERLARRFGSEQAADQGVPYPPRSVRRQFDPDPTAAHAGGRDRRVHGPDRLDRARAGGGRRRRRSRGLLQGDHVCHASDARPPACREPSPRTARLVPSPLRCGRVGGDLVTSPLAIRHHQTCGPEEARRLGCRPS